MKTRIDSAPDEAAELYFILQGGMIRGGMDFNSLTKFLNRHFEVVSKSGLSKVNFAKRATSEGLSLLEAVESWKSQLEVYRIS